MKKTKLIGIIVAVLAIAHLVGYLVISSLNDFSENSIYYKTVEEVLVEKERFETKAVRVNGLLVEESVKQKPGTDQFRFQISKNNRTLNVDYSGILPDSMQPGVEMVVDGVLQPGEDRLVATEILTRCPSKYENIAKGKSR